MKRKEAEKLPETSFTLSPPVFSKYLSKFFKVTVTFPPLLIPFEVTTAVPISIFVFGSTNGCVSE